MVDTPGAFVERRATVKYIGEIPEIAPGYWIGVQYDEKYGRNDGSIKGVQYFECPAEMGSFLRPNYLKIDKRPQTKLKNKEE